MRDEIEQRGERILWEGKPHLLCYLFRSPLLGFVGAAFYQFWREREVGLFITACIWLFHRLLVWWNLRYMQTDKALYLEDNFMGKSCKRFSYDEIHSLSKKPQGKQLKKMDLLSFVINEDKSFFVRNDIFFYLKGGEKIYEDILERMARKRGEEGKHL